MQDKPLSPFLQEWFPIDAKHEQNKWWNFFIKEDDGVHYSRVDNQTLDLEDEAHYRQYIFAILRIGSEIVTYFTTPFTITHSETQRTDQVNQWINGGRVHLLDNNNKTIRHMSVSGTAIILPGVFTVETVQNQKFTALRFEPKFVSNTDGILFPKISVRNRSHEKYIKICRGEDGKLITTRECIDSITKDDLGDFVVVLNEMKLKTNFVGPVNYLYAKVAYVIVYSR